MKGTDRRFKRGAYLLPTLFTVGNLFCGYYAIVATLRGSFVKAALLIFVAALLDGLDGRVARLTGTTSEFGRELDSLSDSLSFGAAPAVMVQAWALDGLGRLGWLASFLFVACGVVRLARFNIQTGTVERRFFTGMPIPAAAVTLAACVPLFPEGLPTQWLEFAMLGLVLLLSVLMISKLRFRSFKDLDLRGRLPYVAAVAVALAFVGVALAPAGVLLVLSLGYVVSGLLPRRIVQRFTEPQSGSGENIETIEDFEKVRFRSQAVIALAAAWAPNPRNPPFYLDLPTKNGERQPTVVSRIAANAPVAIIDQHIDDLRSLEGLAFDAGDAESTIAPSIRVLDEVLNRYDIAHAFEIYEGNPHPSRGVQDRGARSYPSSPKNLPSSDAHRDAIEPVARRFLAVVHQTR